jgi:hypothetical protein
MSQTKRASSGKRPSKAMSVLGVAGVSWAASGSASVADIQPHNAAPLQNFTLADEEISDVSLATFHLVDEADPGTPRTTMLGIQLARGGCGCGGGGGCGGRGCGGCGGGCGFGCGGCFFGGFLYGGCGYGGCGYGGYGYGGSGYGGYPHYHHHHHHKGRSTMPKNQCHIEGQQLICK